MEWEPFATVVRSGCHDRTWIGHVAYATFAETPAGPLRVVKRACEEMSDEGETWRWRNPDPHTWVLEYRVHE